MGQDTCAVGTCTRAARVRGWCNMHYQRWKAHGDPEAGGPPRYRVIAAGTCEVPGCGEVAKARGWCHRHYARWRKHGDPQGGRPDRRRRSEAPPPCKVEGCDAPPRGGYGWCKRHYQKWYKFGDPLAGKDYTRRGAPLRERIEARVAKTAQCWFWLGPLSRDGYGHLNVDGRAIGAHRASYMAFTGPIPEGMVIDHLCRNRACVNPEHLEAVPHEVNVQRGASSNPHTHCNKGHEFTPENTRVVQVCITCDHDARERRARRKRAARLAAIGQAAA